MKPTPCDGIRALIESAHGEKEAARLAEVAAENADGLGYLHTFLIDQGVPADLIETSAHNVTFCGITLNARLVVIDAITGGSRRGLEGVPVEWRKSGILRETWFEGDPPKRKRGFFRPHPDARPIRTLVEATWHDYRIHQVPPNASICFPNIRPEVTSLGDIELPDPTEASP